MNILRQPALVLNKHWDPVHIKPIRRVLGDAVSGSAFLLDPETFAVYTFSDWIRLKVEPNHQSIQAVRFIFRAPEIVILRDYDKRPNQEVRMSRHNLAIRDNFDCQYCGKKLKAGQITIDHVIPSSRIVMG
jgi:5-methylcytosine-specific restriction endonuclease McrA